MLVEVAERMFQTVYIVPRNLKFLVWIDFIYLFILFTHLYQHALMKYIQLIYISFWIFYKIKRICSDGKGSAAARNGFQANPKAKITLGPEQQNIKAVTEACKLIDGCSL